MKPSSPSVILSLIAAFDRMIAAIEKLASQSSCCCGYLQISAGPFTELEGTFPMPTNQTIITQSQAPFKAGVKPMRPDPADPTKEIPGKIDGEATWSLVNGMSSDTDAEGNAIVPTPVDAGTLAHIAGIEDGMAVIEISGALGSFDIQASADVDLGNGVKTLEETYNIKVVEKKTQVNQLNISLTGIETDGPG